MPDWKNIVCNRFAQLQIAPGEEAGLVEEVAQHLEDFYRDQLASGANPEAAYKNTIAQLDDLHPLKDQYRTQTETVPIADAKSGNFIEGLWRDLRYAARTMRRSPAFVLFTVLTLALGIGANSTVFTMINTLVLNPLPIPKSGELYALANKSDSAGSRAPLGLSYPDLKDYVAANQVFESLGAYTVSRPITMQGDQASERVFAEFVTAPYFRALGIEPAKGRFFSAGEDSTPGANPVAVLNYGSWQTRFGGADNILGRTIRLNNQAFTVIGVAPRHFIGVNGLFGPDVWVPASMAEQLLPVGEMHGVLTDRGKTVFQGVGRLKPGVTRAQAQANIETIAGAIARDNPDTNQGQTAVVEPIRDVLFSSANSGSSTILFGSAMLLVVVLIVLLIACSNVANLLLARAAARQQEIAVRLAMGASRRRLIRQLLTESVFLGLLSGAVGLGVAYAALRLIWSSLPSSSNFITPKFDLSVFLFAFAISLATGFLFGAIPAFKASRASVAEELKQEARSVGRSHGKVALANVLLVGQIAFSFLLLVTAALFLRSISRAYASDPGFQTAHLAILLTNPGQTGYNKPQTKAFYQDVRERVAQLPGVESVSWASNLPLWSRAINHLQIEGRAKRSQSENITTFLNTVDVDYFETAGVAIDRGRAFTAIDQETSLPVAIVNEKLAHDYWPSQDAIGKRIQLPGEKEMREIVGIAKTGNYSNWGETPQNCVYVPLTQKFSDAMTLYVRTTVDPAKVLLPMQRAVQAAAPKMVATDKRTGREIVEGGLFQAKMGVALLSVFGLLALCLACVGLYGIMAYSVVQRKREIGLRMALGAAQASVLHMILKQGFSLVLIGIAIGFAASMLVSRLIERLLYGVSASDPLSVAGAAAVLLTVALAACYLPARWASRIDPLVALREG